ncbi:hypothetical protein PTTG_08575 [Puccinia triticina 1-1 BBBD Race 1]|uniref:Uncharacterized protein n=2 Tax=Puccinia triticina TaxID=208348 RepID=A0A0C4F620_PUCT1|nr:uncharacterized protein PtA15_9A423 [Puccinia triticina]OAV98392.1 hypothetical protein PTTG_08575 [Puccinia triticina 1-1 BBBD Race 1]WAQ88296.1 hypothetical protein PtA15_9A423 [Puccinia triticina]WAR60469.1 hypothetical protein PtB15_9B408 [Puccinia triticina]
MRFTCATAGVLVLGVTVSQARSIAPSPWSINHESTEGEALHFVAQISKRSNDDSDGWTSKLSPQDSLHLKSNDHKSDPSPNQAGSENENDGQDDSDSSSRVHEYSEKDDSRQRIILPKNPSTVAIAALKPAPAYRKETPQSTANLLQAIEDYRGAILDGASSESESDVLPEPAKHILQPLNKVQLKKFNETIHELSKNRNVQDIILNHTSGFRTALESLNHTSTASLNLTSGTTMALGNLSSLANNLPIPIDNVRNAITGLNSSSSLAPVTSQANTRAFINISTLSNNLPVTTTSVINGAAPSSEHFAINRSSSSNDTDSMRTATPTHHSDFNNSMSGQTDPTFNHTSPFQK